MSAVNSPEAEREALLAEVEMLRAENANMHNTRAEWMDAAAAHWSPAALDVALTELSSLRRGVAAVRAEIDCAETTGDKGCCSACEGTGYSGEESTGGQCWDCRATGHSHGPVTGEDLPGFIAALRAALAATADALLSADVSGQTKEAQR